MTEFGHELRATRLPEVTEVNPGSIENAPDLLLPSVSYDRALSHFASYVDVDMQAIHDFYHALPHADKLPLDQLHIHFSAARPVNKSIETISNGDFSRYGTRFVNSRAEQKVSPELDATDKPTIRIYVGSAMPELFSSDEFKDADRTMLSAIMSESISETLAHELAHFAQTSPEDLSLSLKDRAKHRTQQAVAKLVLATMRNKYDLVVGAGVFGISEIATDGHIGSVATGLGAASLSLLTNRKRRRTQQAETSYQRYEQREVEVDAREHEDDAPELCRVSLLHYREFPEGYELEDFIKPEDERAGLYIANSKHKDLSTTPRGENPKEIRKAANKSELRAVGIKSRARRAKNRAVLRRARDAYLPAR